MITCFQIGIMKRIALQLCHVAVRVCRAARHPVRTHLIGIVESLHNQGWFTLSTGLGDLICNKDSPIGPSIEALWSRSFQIWHSTLSYSFILVLSFIVNTASIRELNCLVTRKLLSYVYCFEKGTSLRVPVIGYLTLKYPCSQIIILII